MKHTRTPRKWKDLNLYNSNDTEILAGATYIFNLSDHYEVYDYAEITNLNSDEDCLIVINGSEKIPLPKGNQYTLTRPFRSISIINNGTGIVSANQIRVSYSHISKKKNFINTGLKLLGGF